MTSDDRAVGASAEKLKGRPAKRRSSGAADAGSEPQIGQALRSVYDRTVSEAIPDDLLALLGRLD